jgi:hypothetical protein
MKAADTLPTTDHSGDNTQPITPNADLTEAQKGKKKKGKEKAEADEAARIEKVNPIVEDLKRRSTLDLDNVEEEQINDALTQWKELIAFEQTAKTISPEIPLQFLREAGESSLSGLVAMKATFEDDDIEELVSHIKSKINDERGNINLKIGNISPENTKKLFTTLGNLRHKSITLQVNHVEKIVEGLKEANKDKALNNSFNLQIKEISPKAAYIFWKYNISISTDDKVIKAKSNPNKVNFSSISSTYGNETAYSRALEYYTQNKKLENLKEIGLGVLALSTIPLAYTANSMGISIFYSSLILGTNLPLICFTAIALCGIAASAIMLYKHKYTERDDLDALYRLERLNNDGQTFLEKVKQSIKDNPDIGSGSSDGKRAGTPASLRGA